MKLFVTVLEESAEDAVRAIRALEEDHDGVEVRAERFPAFEHDALRAATAKPILLTLRGKIVSREQIDAALRSGIDLVDVEFGDDMPSLEGIRDRVVLSHHDYEGIGELETIAARMLTLGCAETKIAVSPRSFADNERLLALLRRKPAAGSELSVIGMGERGLYSRILAPFIGSSLAFVAGGRVAAPGQLPLSRALEIYGDDRASLACEAVFAVAGNPAGHSLSPSIHNPLFRARGLKAAYTIASVESFEEIREPFLRGEPRGLSVTAPFKEEALTFAREQQALIAENAAEAGAVNTLLNSDGGIVADNTDVDGFLALLRDAGSPRCVAIVGAGGTARAAAVAAGRISAQVTIFNRTAGKLGARPLAELAEWEGDCLIDTLPHPSDLPLRRGLTVIHAGYGGGADDVEGERRLGVRVYTGLDLLRAQAVRQHALFAGLLEHR